MTKNAAKYNGQAEFNLDGKEFLLTNELQTKQVSDLLKITGQEVTPTEIRNKLKHDGSLELSTSQGLFIVRLSPQAKVGSRYMCDVSVRPRSFTNIAA